MLDFSGQQVLIVGGSSGIGFATAALAASLGAEVTIASRTHDKVQRATEALGRGVTGHVVDVTSDEDVERFFSHDRTWDHVVVTGSQTTILPVRTSPMDVAQASFNSKFWGFYRIARAVHIRDGGSLAVVAGFLATRPNGQRALMGAINAALEALVRGLALELKPVRVNAVSPAMVDTEMWGSREQREAAAAKVGATYPAGRIGTPEDIARQLLLLAATSYATGTIVTLDGGASIA